MLSLSPWLLRCHQLPSSFRKVDSLYPLITGPRAHRELQRRPPERFTRVVDELRSRRRAFRPGRQIRLADGQFWTFPRAESDLRTEDEGRAEYRGLLGVLLEAETDSDRRMAELALAIHLLEINYQLHPENLAYLLTFPDSSTELADSQREFAELAREHIQADMEARGYVPTAGPSAQASPRRLPPSRMAQGRLQQAWGPVPERPGRALSGPLTPAIIGAAERGRDPRPRSARVNLDGVTWMPRRSRRASAI